MGDFLGLDCFGFLNESFYPVATPLGVFEVVKPCPISNVWLPYFPRKDAELSGSINFDIYFFRI